DGTKNMLVATRLADGATLWSETLDPGYPAVVASSTVLYVVVSNNHKTFDLMAINMQNGHTIWLHEPQSSPQIVLDKGAIFVQELANNEIGLYEQIYALRADNGKTLWSYVFKDT